MQYSELERDFVWIPCLEESENNGMSMQRISGRRHIVESDICSGR